MLMRLHSVVESEEYDTHGYDQEMRFFARYFVRMEKADDRKISFEDLTTMKDEHFRYLLIYPQDRKKIRASASEFF